MTLPVATSRAALTALLEGNETALAWLVLPCLPAAAGTTPEAAPSRPAVSHSRRGL